LKGLNIARHPAAGSRVGLWLVPAILLLMLGLPAVASAGLGGDESSIEADQAQMSASVRAVQPDRITGLVDSSQIATLPGHVHRKAKPQYDQGRVETSFQLSQVTLLTLPSPSQQKALSLLVAEQQNPSSANYRKWLTPEQYADRFGLSQNDVQRISAWLKSQGLSVVSVARGRNWIVFSGTAAQIESAFRTEIHHYNVDGKMHFANATPPSIPAALSGIATGIRGLDDFHPKPRHVRKAAPRPDYYDNNFIPPDFLAPGDIATIYDLRPLYAAGIDGTGQKLAVVGQSDVYLSDLNNFRSGFGLIPISGCTTNASGVITACNSSNFRYVLDGPDPGVSPGDLGESDLDLEWSAATARGAQIIFVNSTDVGTSFYYAIDNDLAPVISMSYGECEFDDNDLDADEVELTKANSFGITFINSTDDSGAAGCDNPTNAETNNLAVYGLAVSYPASSPEVTGVGGTAIPYPGGFTSTYWGTTNPTDGGTAIFYIPEISWNDDVELAAAFGGTALSVQEDFGISSSGGGASNCSTQTADFSSCVTGFPQPAWQTVTIPGQASFRFTPDVSLLGSPDFPGYILCTQLSELGDSGTGSSCGSGGAAGITGALALPNPSVFGGTSASAQVFAGIVTVLNQFLNGPSSPGLSNINPTLYKLAATPSNNAFHQVTSGTNVVYCEVGTPTDMPTLYQCPSAGFFGYSASNFDATTHFNLVTGLGSVDVNNLAHAWAAIEAPAASLSPISLFFGTQLLATPSAADPVTLTNSGGSALTINSIAVAGGNSSDFGVKHNCPISPNTLAAGNSCTLHATFTPQAAGPRKSSISISDNSGSGVQTILLTGVGAAISTVPPSLTFNSQQVGTPSTAQAVTITNEGATAVNLWQITFLGANAGDFSKSNTSNCGNSLGAGANCTVNVIFTPAAAGSRTASLLISDDGGGSPQAVALAGTGTSGPAARLSTSAVVFGEQAVGTTSSAETVVLTNKGSAPLAIGSMTVVEATGDDFVQTNTCGASLAPGASCTIKIRFTPRAAGRRTAVISVLSGHQSGNLQLKVQGTGSAGRRRLIRETE